ncbi:MAG: N-acetylmuramoyl-L-alanine amidase [bacterium]
MNTQKKYKHSLFKKSFSLLLFSVFFTKPCLGMPFFPVHQKNTIIMLCPAGDAKNPGRTLTAGYERGQTFRFAEQLQQKLSQHYGFQTIIARKPGYYSTNLQTASFANQLSCNFFLKIHIYKENIVKPQIYMYHHVYNPLTDSTLKSFSAYDFIPLHLAHTCNICTSKAIGDKIKTSLSKDTKKFDCYGPYGIPLVSLVGILAPALLIEIGIDQDNKWQTMIDEITQSLHVLVDL